MSVVYIVKFFIYIYRKLYNSAHLDSLGLKCIFPAMIYIYAYSVSQYSHFNNLLIILELAYFSSNIFALPFVVKIRSVNTIYIYFKQLQHC